MFKSFLATIALLYPPYCYKLYCSPNPIPRRVWKCSSAAFSRLYKTPEFGNGTKMSDEK